MLVFVGNCFTKTQLELEHPGGGVMVTPSGVVQLNWYELAVELPVLVSVAVTVVVSLGSGFGVTVKRIVFAAFAGSANAANMTVVVRKPVLAHTIHESFLIALSVQFFRRSHSSGDCDQTSEAEIDCSCRRANAQGVCPNTVEDRFSPGRVTNAVSAAFPSTRSVLEAIRAAFDDRHATQPRDATEGDASSRYNNITQPLRWSSSRAAELTRLQEARVCRRHAFALEASVVLAEARLGQANAAAALDVLDRAAQAAGSDANLIRPGTARVRARALALLGRVAEAENEIASRLFAAREHALRYDEALLLVARSEIASDGREAEDTAFCRADARAWVCSARRGPRKIRWLQPEAEPRVSYDARRSRPEHMHLR